MTGTVKFAVVCIVMCLQSIDLVSRHFVGTGASFELKRKSPVI